MAYTKDDLLKLEGAEVVGGNVVHGILGEREFVGKINDEGVFYITEVGEQRLKALEEAAKPKAKAKKVVDETAAE